MKQIFVLIVLLGIYSSRSTALAQDVVKGIVYEDNNENNRRDRNEKGIAGVGVSNGVEVVATNEKGEYELPATDDAIIFVIKPAGYAAPLNEFNLPRFYYIHKPEGSPKLKYKGVEPTGDIPRNVNFPLFPRAQKDTFKILAFGDPQPYTAEEVDFFDRGIVSEVAGISGVEFGISLGDLVGDNLDLFDPYKRAVSRVGTPWYNVLGNHDLNFDGETDPVSDETFERHFGPSTYSFNHGMTHFIILDDVLYPDPRDGRGYFGGLREDQLIFIENDLKLTPKDRLIVIAAHIPLSEGFREADRLKLFELLKDYPHTLSLSAHTHIQNQEFFDKETGWLQEEPHHHYNVGTTSGDWYSGTLNEAGIPVSTMRDGTPKGYAFLTLNGNRYEIDYKVAGQPAEYRFNIFAPKVVEQNKGTSAGIYVNYFQGGIYDTLFVRIDDGEWRRMNRVADYDPAYLHLLHKWDHTEELLSGRRPSNPARCSHLWRAPVPTRLDEGERTIEVKVVDQFGRTFMQTSAYRIAVRKK